MNTLVSSLFAAILVASSVNAGPYLPYYRPLGVGAVRGYYYNSVAAPVAPVVPAAPFSAVPGAPVVPTLDGYYGYSAASALAYPYGYPYNYNFLGSYTGYPFVKK